MRILFILTIVPFLFACAAGGPKYSDINFEKTPGQSEVYIFRLNKFVDGGSCYELRIDGEDVGGLGNGGFIRKEMPPGNHVASIPMVNKTHLELSFQSKMDEPTYIQFNVALNRANGIPESATISERSDYVHSRGELLNFNNLLVQVKPEYALEKMAALKDSSVKVSCMATVRHKD